MFEMKNIFAKTIAIALMGVSLASCDLNLYPEGSIIYDEEKGFFTNIDDVLGAETAVYSNFKATTGGFYNFLEELMFDSFNATLSSGNNYGSIHKTDAGFTSSDQDIESFWGNYYLTLKNYNVTIDAAAVAPAEIFEDARFVKGEACAARAYAYLQLARHFGPKYNEATADTDLCVPLVLHYDQNARPARNTMSEVYTQILEDLDSALVILTDYEVANEVNSLYFTPDAVKAMMARALLDMGDYEAAADTAKSVIESEAGYTLANTAKQLDSLRSFDTGKEAIMQLFASTTETPNGYGLFTSFEQDSKSPTGYSYYRPYFFPTKTLMDLYENNDIRKIAWFRQTVAHPACIEGGYSDNVFLFSKYLGNVNYSSNGLPSGLVASKPFMISEMYLIAAEGYFNAGETTLGKRYLNQLQAMRGATPSALNEETIQKEWKRETVCEGLRLSNMKRWDAGFKGRQPQTYTGNLIMTTPADSFQDKALSSDDKAYVWPIPSYEIKINPALEQNPGYGNN